MADDPPDRTDARPQDEEREPSAEDEGEGQSEEVSLGIGEKDGPLRGGNKSHSEHPDEGRADRLQAIRDPADAVLHLQARPREGRLRGGGESSDDSNDEEKDEPTESPVRGDRGCKIVLAIHPFAEEEDECVDEEIRCGHAHGNEPVEADFGEFGANETDEGGAFMRSDGASGKGCGRHFTSPQK